MFVSNSNIEILFETRNSSSIYDARKSYFIKKVKYLRRIEQSLK